MYKTLSHHFSLFNWQQTSSFVLESYYVHVLCAWPKMFIKLCNNPLQSNLHRNNKIPFQPPSFMNSDMSFRVNLLLRLPSSFRHIITQLHVCTFSDYAHSRTFHTLTFLLKQNHCLTPRTVFPKTIPRRNPPRELAPFTTHRTTEQQRRNGHISQDRHKHHRHWDVSAPIRLSSAQWLHTDEWRVRLITQTWSPGQKRLIILIYLHYFEWCPTLFLFF